MAKTTGRKTHERPPRGMRGPAGRRGPAGPAGPKGERGERGPGVVPIESVEKLEREIEKMRAEAETQFKRIAQLQAQLDVALAEIQRIKGQK